MSAVSGEAMSYGQYQGKPGRRIRRIADLYKLREGHRSVCYVHNGKVTGVRPAAVELNQVAWSLDSAIRRGLLYVYEPPPRGSFGGTRWVILRNLKQLEKAVASGANLRWRNDFRFFQKIDRQWLATHSALVTEVYLSQGRLGKEVGRVKKGKKGGGKKC